MSDQEWLTAQFESNRDRLRSVAFRVLGSASDADDAVQETWLRLHRSDTSAVENLSGWLTTVVSRVSLDMLRSRQSRREEALDSGQPELIPDDAARIDPEEEAILADAMGPALLLVLDSLGPVERLSFVLHDIFAVPFDEIADIVGRSPAAVRQLTSRARRRIRGNVIEGQLDQARQREIVSAFLAASRGGDFAALVELLDPQVVLRADQAAVLAGAEPEVHGAEAVAGTFAGRARAAQMALVNGAAGAVWAPGGTPRVVFEFTIIEGRIATIDLRSDPDHLGRLALEILQEGQLPAVSGTSSRRPSGLPAILRDLAWRDISTTAS